jgi:hypothetical protein
VFTGIGPLGYRKRFNWREVQSVRVKEKLSRRGGVSERVSLEGQTSVDVASGLNTERRHFMVAALRQMLRERR